MALLGLVEQFTDVVHVVAEVNVKGDDIVAAGVGYAEFHCLAEAEISRVVQNAHAGLRGSVGCRNAPAIVAAAVVHDQQFPAVARLEGLQVGDDFPQVPV